MSRVHRASTAALFTYAQFALAMIIGIVLVPFILERVGVRLYGYWLASGEILAYAAMADFGVLGVVPWLVAEADGRGDRQGMRRLLSAGFGSALVLSAVYLGLVVALWQVAPAILALSAAERRAIAGPLALLAGVTSIVLPLRVATSALIGLQDVKACGVMTTVGRFVDVVLVVVLLYRGHGLYALAIAVSASSLLTALLGVVRLRILAPDLLRAWPRPALEDVSRLFREGLGAWLGAWGWRLSAATDAIVIAWIGSPVWITVLAMTGKIGSMLTQMSWVPGDSGLVGLANLRGEDRPDRVRDAVLAVLRVYLTLATAAACVVLVANGAFVRAWVGPELFGGVALNALLAIIILVVTMAHAAAVVASTLGQRMRVGVATLASGAVQVAAAVVLGRQLGLIGVPLATLSVQALLLIPLLLLVLARSARVVMGDVARGAWRPWALRAVPAIAACGMAGPYVSGLPVVIAVPLGVVAAALYLWFARGPLLEYPPVAAVVRSRLSRVRLDGLVPAGATRPRVP